MSTNHCRAGLDEPVKSELRSLSNGRPQFVIDVLSVEAELVQHTHEESIFFLRVVLALVSAVLDAQLMEWCTITSHLMTTKYVNASYKVQIGIKVTQQFSVHYFHNAYKL